MLEFITLRMQPQNRKKNNTSRTMEHSKPSQGLDSLLVSDTCPFIMQWQLCWVIATDQSWLGKLQQVNYRMNVSLTYKVHVY